MGTADSLSPLEIDAGCDLVPGFHRAAGQMSVVNDEVAVFLCVGDAELESIADDDAGIADLAARFGVKRRAVKDDLNWVRVPDLGQLIEQMILSDDAADFCRRFGRFVAEEFGRLERLFQSLDGTGLEYDIGDF